MWANYLFLGIPVCLVSLEKLDWIEHLLQYGHGYIMMHVYSIFAKKLKAHWKKFCLKRSLPTWAGSEWWMAMCHLLLVAQSYLALCKPMDSNPPGSSVHRILQVRILKWVAIPFSRGSSRAKDQTCVSCTAADSLQSEPPGKIVVLFELISFSISQRGMLLLGLYPWWQGSGTSLMFYLEMFAYKCFGRNDILFFFFFLKALLIPERFLFVIKLLFCIGVFPDGTSDKEPACQET